MKLLVLEDGGDFARVLTSVLHGAGIAVTHCSDGAGVQAELGGNPPDILLIDADTGGQTGLDVLRQLRRNPIGAGIPVILTSALLSESDPKVARASEECGVNRFMPRPLQVLDLERILREASNQAPSSKIPVRASSSASSSSTSGAGSQPSSTWTAGRHGEVPRYKDVLRREGTPGSSASRARRRSKRDSPPPPTNLSQPADGTDALMTLRRLRRETQHLASADDWTILGIPRCKDLDRIEVARARMASRYATIASHDGYSDEIHDMATAISKKIEQAAGTLSKKVTRALEAAANRAAVIPDEPDEYAANPEDFVDQLFLKGQAAIASGDIASATRFLRQARNENLNSARNMAWLGWALYQETDRPLQERQRAALELLELADQFDGEFPDGQFFLATVEHGAGLDTRAAARLRRLLKRKNHHLGARRLYERVQAALVPPPPTPDVEDAEE